VDDSSTLLDWPGGRGLDMARDCNQRPGRHGTRRVEKWRVLVVDDDPVTTETFGWALRELEVETIAVTMVDEAVTEVRRAAAAGEPGAGFDLWIVDLQLRDKAGLDLVRQLRAEGNRTPFIIVSGFATVETAVEAMKLGALTVLEKPLDIEELLAVVRVVLDRGSRAAAPPPAMAPRAAPPEIGRRSAAERWASFVWRAVGSHHDPRTLDEWARLVGVSRSVLCECCRLVHVSPHDARDFARLIRAILRSGATWQPETALDVADARTLKKLLARSGLPHTARTTPTLQEFFARQRWIPPDNPGVVALLARLGIRSEPPPL
jgi:DNA-binding response OmpR family regulator